MKTLIITAVDDNDNKLEIQEVDTGHFAIAITSKESKNREFVVLEQKEILRILKFFKII